MWAADRFKHYAVRLGVATFCLGQSIGIDETNISYIFFVRLKLGATLLDVIVGVACPRNKLSLHSGKNILKKIKYKQTSTQQSYIKHSFDLIICQL